MLQPIWAKGAGHVGQMHVNGLILPPLIRSLPNLEVLDVSDCSQLHYIADVPNTIRKLYMESNDSLQQVLLDPSTKLKVFDAQGSFNLNDAIGLFKNTLIENVENKIIRLLGLESIHAIRTRHIPIRVYYEFGIFSTLLHNMEELPGCFTFRAKSKHLAFKVPSLPSDRKICGFKLCFLSHSPFVESGTVMKVEIHNTTRAINWMYTPPMLHFSYEFVWSSVWKCGDFMEMGDEVQIHIVLDLWESAFEVKECGINLIYEDFMLKKQETNARKEEKRGIEEWREIGTSSQLSWTDKLIVEISNYCNNGKRYLFTSSRDDNIGPRQHVNWWGPISYPWQLCLYGSICYYDSDFYIRYNEALERDQFSGTNMTTICTFSRTEGPSTCATSLKLPFSLTPLRLRKGKHGRS